MDKLLESDTLGKQNSHRECASNLKTVPEESIVEHRERVAFVQRASQTNHESSVGVNDYEDVILTREQKWTLVEQLAMANGLN